MDIGIAVSLIRGQMGAVVERAVNVAVETVLAEMLKVVGVKFEELKAQLAHTRQDVAALQREKALKEKENDNIRAKLRYTELKLKYYRQGVEEELQHRVSGSSALVRNLPSKLSPGQGGGAGVFSTGASPTCSSQTLTVDLAASSIRECTSPQSVSQHTMTSAAISDPTDSLLAVSLPMSAESPGGSGGTTATPTSSTVNTTGVCAGTLCATDQGVHGESDWDVVPPPQEAAVQQSSTSPTLADSSTTQTLMTVKMEEEAGQVICIKEEPEEEHEVISRLLLDNQLNCNQSEMSAMQWEGLEAGHRKCSSSFSSAGPSSYAAPQPPMAALAPGAPRQVARSPWTEGLSLYEEYKLRRNELRRRSLNRRRELEKTLPQPLLADLVRERREKTRLRVARWRAKRKLQACLNQVQVSSDTSCQVTHWSSRRRAHVQTQGGAVAFPISGPHRSPHAANNNMVISAVTTFPFVTPPSSSLLLRGPNMAAQFHQHAGMSSSSYPQVSVVQQSVCQTDANVPP
ncbi:uncharacterized protein LOC133538143 isoform X1 [Nerophis ophidion]|uniref:uncharacterized protein LOC133538143 isoform X1 n=1 Tax=Nerophis ophidion TaxID=159077 RepID=UPI002AE01EF4|nr:uncharacterized protein LOC133538143 isoform X1 [Nerophis ophidion]